MFLPTVIYYFICRLFKVEEDTDLALLSGLGHALKSFATNKGKKREFEHEFIKKAIFAASFILSVFLIYFSIFSYVMPIVYRGFFVSMIIAIALIVYSPPENKTNKVRIIDYILSFLALGCGAYLVINARYISFRISHFDPMYTHEIILGLILVFLVLEATRRVAGWPLTVIGILFATYPFYGKFFTGMFGHRGYPLDDVIDTLFMTTNGIMGIPVGVASSYVFLFVLFGTFLNITGGGDYFFKLPLIACISTE